MQRTCKPWRRFACRAAALTLAAGLWLPAGAVADGELKVFAASSLREALDEAIAAYPGPTVDVKAIYAASSTLARQIEQGAPADVVISASVDWMDYLEERRLLRPSTRGVFARNRLVLIAPADSAVRLSIAPGFDPAATLDGGRLAVGDPDHVPAGIYAREALEFHGAWQSVQDRLARAASARAALALVARGETPLGIVYRSDALAESGVRIVDVFPAASHSPIVYLLAVCAESGHPAAGRFADYLRSPAVARTLRRHGFGAEPGSAAPAS